MAFVIVKEIRISTLKSQGTKFGQKSLNILKEDYPSEAPERNAAINTLILYTLYELNGITLYLDFRPT